MQRTAEIARKTSETDIFAKINLDGVGNSNINTGIAFFDHMLTQIAKHGLIDIEINANGDTDVDSHHTVEDVGIVLGKCLQVALGEKEGIERYGYFVLPMEEALVLCSLDLSGRPFLNFSASFTSEMLGSMQTEMIEEFFRAICLHGGINIHIKMMEGKNNHHIAEAIFKAFAKALMQSVTINPRINGVLSSKGSL